MWFKNIIVYRLPDPPASLASFEKNLASKPLQPCGKTETASVGWLSPYGGHQSTLVHAANGCWLFAMGKEERLLPAAVVKEELEEKIATISAQEQRQVFRKEKQRLKEEIQLRLLPKAFTRKIMTYAYIDSRNKLLVIDSSNVNKAEALIMLLRETCGSFVALPLQVKLSAQAVLTDWLLNESHKESITIEDKCEMIDPQQEGATLKCNKQDLQQEEIQTHLLKGKRVKSLAISWQDSMALSIDDHLIMKQIRPLSILVEKRKEVAAETAYETLDADFALMSMEFASLFADIVEQMGGIDKQEQPAATDEQRSAVVASSE